MLQLGQFTDIVAHNKPKCMILVLSNSRVGYSVFIALKSYRPNLLATNILRNQGMNVHMHTHIPTHTCMTTTVTEKETCKCS